MPVTNYEGIPTVQIGYKDVRCVRLMWEGAPTLALYNVPTDADAVTWRPGDGDRPAVLLRFADCRSLLVVGGWIIDLGIRATDGQETLKASNATD